MKVICNDQRTDEWLEARQGHITASAIASVLAKSGTMRRKDYLLDLAQDLAGDPDFGLIQPEPWFEDGRIWEDWARGWYQWNYEIEVETTGFIEHDEYSWLGCSPDGLIGSEGLLEIKYRKMRKTFDAHCLKVSRAELNQMQTQLFVTGRAWCDYLNYYRQDDETEAGHVQRIYPSPEIHAYIEEHCLLFWRDVLSLFEQRNQGDLA